MDQNRRIFPVKPPAGTSSRRLERECNRNKELIWLTGNLAPDFKTIADFRKDNLEALKNLFKEFLKFCYKLELLSFKTVAIDGSKMRGQNSQNEVYRKDQMERIEKEIQEKIDNYLQELDRLDCIEQNDKKQLAPMIEQVKEQKKVLGRWKQNVSELRLKSDFCFMAVFSHMVCGYSCVLGIITNPIIIICCLQGTSGR